MSPADTLIAYNKIHDALERNPLFDRKTWLLSPLPFHLTRKQVEELKAIGRACYEFYNVMERLYRKSLLHEAIVRNDSNAKADWVAEYLNRGKPQRLIEHNSHESNKHSIPCVIRPDLLITSDGFALTELDAVPGGIGLTAFLGAFYKHSGFSSIIGEAADGMVSAFYQTIANQCPKRKDNPIIAIVVSDEAQTYRPEFEWLSRQLCKQGKHVYCLHPNELHFQSDHSIQFKNKNEWMRIDVIYRFFELFDLHNIPEAEKIMRAVEEGQVTLTPPMRTFQEEKMNLAFFHDSSLQAFWEEQLSTESLQLLRKIIPKTWIVDQIELPHGAYLEGPTVDGKAMHNWMDLAKATQKERNYILKISGFSELSWGARSVTLGNDVSQERWTAAIEQAIQSAKSNPYVIQEYRKPMIINHLVYKSPENYTEMEGRVRLCPYYFIDQEKKESMMGGILATVCPADKKIIHGMSEAALVPCKIDEKSS